VRRLTVSRPARPAHIAFCPHSAALLRAEWHVCATSLFQTLTKERSHLITDRSLWAILRDALLNDVTFNPAGTSGVDNSNSESESPRAQVLRQLGEKPSRGDFSSSQYMGLNEPPQQTFGGAPTSSALWPLLLAGTDLALGPTPSSPSFPRADMSFVPPPRGLSRLASDFVPSQRSVRPSGVDSEMAQLGSWPSPSTFGQSMSPAGSMPVNYQDAARPRPWWDPPGVFDPWAEQFIRGMQGLLNFRSRPRAGDPNAPGCKEEWEAARKQCIEWLSSPNPPRGVTGGYRNIEDCARGLVSERCGGNPRNR
jgi:hypothetical protein